MKVFVTSHLCHARMMEGIEAVQTQLTDDQEHLALMLQQAECTGTLCLTMVDWEDPQNIPVTPK